jgi:hypothetical protein
VPLSRLADAGAPLLPHAMECLQKPQAVRFFVKKPPVSFAGFFKVFSRTRAVFDEDGANYVP